MKKHQHFDQTDADKGLIGKLTTAIEAFNETKKAVETATTEMASRSKVIGQLLLEAKKLHPKVEQFEAFLNRVGGIGSIGGISRAYDFMRVAGGRITDEQLREEARERKQKSRARKLPPPAPPPLPRPTSENAKPTLSVTKPYVTESPEISVEQRRRENANLAMPAAERSKQNLEWFAVACREYLPNITVEMHRQEARRLVAELTKSKVA